MHVLTCMDRSGNISYLDLPTGQSQLAFHDSRLHLRLQTPQNSLASDVVARLDTHHALVHLESFTDITVEIRDHPLDIPCSRTDGRHHLYLTLDTQTCIHFNVIHVKLLLGASRPVLEPTHNATERPAIKGIQMPSPISDHRDSSTEDDEMEPVPTAEPSLPRPKINEEEQDQAADAEVLGSSQPRKVRTTYGSRPHVQKASTPVSTGARYVSCPNYPHPSQ